MRPFEDVEVSIQSMRRDSECLLDYAHVDRAIQAALFFTSSDPKGQYC